MHKPAANLRPLPALPLFVLAGLEKITVGWLVEVNERKHDNADPAPDEKMFQQSESTRARPSAKRVPTGR